VRAVVEIGHIMGRQVVAEGVETADQLQTLTAVGCTGTQGYHLTRPAPAEVVGPKLPGWMRGDVLDQVGS
jgi:EAL domain-containing protein (putative c-di-GMP-specific phosphodiesterase class I)